MSFCKILCKVTAKETEFITQAYFKDDVSMTYYSNCNKIISIQGNHNNWNTALYSFAKVPRAFEDYVRGRDSQFAKVKIIMNPDHDYHPWESCNEVYVKGASNLHWQKDQHEHSA